jgi:hypothetical protein
MPWLDFSFTEEKANIYIYRHLDKISIACLVYTQNRLHVMRFVGVNVMRSSIYLCTFSACGLETT